MRQTARSGLPTTLALGLLAALGLAAPVAGAADLLEVYQRALQSDPQIREAEALRLASLEAKPQALAGLLPTFNATGSRNKREIEQEQQSLIVGSGVGSVSNVRTVNASTDVYISQYQLQLTQPVFRWDRWVALRRADSTVAQAEADFAAAEQDLIARIAQRYFNVLAAKDTLEANEGALEAVSRQLEQTDQRFEVGLIAITDVQEARASRDQASAAVIAAKRAVATAEELLRELTGEKFMDLAAPGEDMPLQTPAPESEDQWVAAAMEQNLDLISARLAADIARDDIDTARTSHFPTLDLVATRLNTDQVGTQQTITDGITAPLGPSNNDNNQDTIGLQITVPIYSGGAVSSRVRE